MGFQQILERIRDHPYHIDSFFENQIQVLIILKPNPGPLNGKPQKKLISSPMVQIHQWGPPLTF